MIRIHQFQRKFKGEKPVDMVEISARSAILETGAISSSTWHRVENLRPRSNDDNDFRARYQAEVWASVEPAYEAWLAGQDLPTHGTPLAAWAGVTAEQAKVMAQWQVRTVEDLRDLTDSGMQAVPLPNMRELRKAAAGFLDSRGSAEMAARMAELEAQNAAMLEMLADQPEKRGPGRPKKQAEEAAA